MQVEMELEVARPGLEDGRHAKAGAEAAGVEAEGEERAGGRPEEEGEEAAAVTQDEGAKLGGEREDDVEVVAGKEAGHPRVDPAGLAQRLALRAVATAAGVVRGARVATRVTDIEVPAALGGAAGFDRAHRGALVARERVPAAVRGPVRAADVGDLQDILENPAISCQPAVSETLTRPVR
jgi:hypothetical protein